MSTFNYSTRNIQNTTHSHYLTQPQQRNTDAHRKQRKQTPDSHNDSQPYEARRTESHRGSELYEARRTENHRGSEPYEAKTENHRGSEPYQAKTETHRGSEPYQAKTENHRGSEPYQAKTENHRGSEPYQAKTENHRDSEPYQAKTENHRGSEPYQAKTENHRVSSLHEIQTHQHSSSEEDKEQASSRNELRQKSKELHQILAKRNVAGGMLTKKATVVPIPQGGRNSDNETSIGITDNEFSNSKSERDGNLKHVILIPDRRVLSGNESSGAEICKKLFGISVLEYSNGKHNWSHIGKDRKVVVQGVAEGSSSYSSGRIHRGDMLVRINDVDITWQNFAHLLNTLHKRKKVKLTFQSPRIVGPRSSYSILKVPESDLCVSVAGKNLAHIQADLSGVPYVVLYLTLVRSSSEAETDDKEDVVYAFPPDEQPLTALRGLFVTVSSALVDVVGQSASCSHLCLNGSPVNVAYRQFAGDVLVLAMPEDRMSVTSLASMLNSFCSLMALLFSDVKSAFSNCDRNWLDKILAIMFYDALVLNPSSQAYQTRIPAWPSNRLTLAMRDYHFVKVLHLSHENKLICDEILNEYEAMDFDEYLDSKDLFSRRQFVIRGTSLYYKDYLLSSHVPSDQQRDINLFMNYHGLLALSSRQHVDQVLVWQELKLYLCVDTSSLPAGYRPTQAPTFLLILGLNHYLLAAVLELGGCSQSAEGQRHPSPLFIEQAKATLGQLEMDEVHMSQCCEERLMNTRERISLASADKLCRVTSPRNRASSRDTTLSGPSSESQKQSKSLSRGTFFRSKSMDRLDDSRGASGMTRQGSKHSYGSNDSTGSGSSTGRKSKGSRMSSVADLPGMARSSSVLQIDAPRDMLREERLSRGKETTLFSFVHLDSAEGVLVSPTDAELVDLHSDLQQQVLESFSCATCKIRALLRQKNDSTDQKQSLYRTCAAGEDDPCREAGVLFCCTLESPSDKKRQVTTLNYWVVGRLWTTPNLQEMYVCFHESADQSLVEMAFTLRFGV